MKLEEFLQQLDKKPKPRSQDDKFTDEIVEFVKSHISTHSIDELNVEIHKLTERHNRFPRYEFAGLSSEEMHWILDHPLEERSPIRFRSGLPDDVLDKIGFFRLVEELLKIAKRDGGIKLTAKLGALPRKTLLELYDHHFVPQWPIDEGLFKLRVEDDSAVMGTLHAIAHLSGLMRKFRGKLVLTKLGEKMLSANDREQLFKLIFHTFTMGFDWAYNDCYPDFPLCRDAFGFSLYLVANFGREETHKDFYAEKFLTALPMSLDEFQDMPYSTAESSFKSCYKVRTFDRFLEWFNLVEVRHHIESDHKHGKSLVKKSELMDAVFTLR